jgi:hypothetical protein
MTNPSSDLDIVGEPRATTKNITTLSTGAASLRAVVEEKILDVDHKRLTGGEAASLRFLLHDV